MENMDKEPTVPKWVLINQRKIPQMPQKNQPKLSVQAQKFGIFEKKLSLGVRSPWANSSFFSSTNVFSSLYYTGLSIVNVI